MPGHCRRECRITASPPNAGRCGRDGPNPAAMLPQASAVSRRYLSPARGRRRAVCRSATMSPTTQPGTIAASRRNYLFDPHRWQRRVRRYLGEQQGRSTSIRFSLPRRGWRPQQWTASRGSVVYPTAISRAPSTSAPRTRSRRGGLIEANPPAGEPHRAHWFAV